MTHFVFSRADGTLVTFKTDLIDINAQKFTIMEIRGLKYTDPNGPALQTLFGVFSKGKPYHVPDFTTFAAANNLHLERVPIGNTDSKVVLNSEQLATPVLTPTVNSATQITLTWPAVTNATGYKLERATNVGFTTGLTTIYTGPLLTKVDTGLTTATHYYYRLTAQAAGFTDSTYGLANATTN